MDLKEIELLVYRNIIKEKHFPRWKGRPILKNPTDLLLYHEVIYEKKPDIIIETGTKWCGSALFLADMCELVGNGRVISIDIVDRQVEKPEHDRLSLITGNSIDKNIVEQLAKEVEGKTVMVILDSAHTEKHCKFELFRYSKLVTPGQYMVLEDVYDGRMNEYGVTRARDWFLQRTKKFKLVNLVKKYLFGMTKDGWMLRR